MVNNILNEGYSIEEAFKALGKSTSERVVEAVEDSEKEYFNDKEYLDDEEYLENAKKFAEEVKTLPEDQVIHYYFVEYNFENNAPKDAAEKIIFEALRDRMATIARDSMNAAQETEGEGSEHVDEGVDPNHAGFLSFISKALGNNSEVAAAARGAKDFKIGKNGNITFIDSRGRKTTFNSKFKKVKNEELEEAAGDWTKVDSFEDLMSAFEMEEDAERDWEAGGKDAEYPKWIFFDGKQGKQYFDKFAAKGEFWLSPDRKFLKHVDNNGKVMIQDWDDKEVEDLEECNNSVSEEKHETCPDCGKEVCECNKNMTEANGNEKWRALSDRGERLKKDLWTDVYDDLTFSGQEEVFVNDQGKKSVRAKTNAGYDEISQINCDVVGPEGFEVIQVKAATPEELEAAREVARKHGCDFEDGHNREGYFVDILIPQSEINM